MTEFTAPNIKLADARYCNHCPMFNDDYFNPDHNYCQMDNKITLEMDHMQECRGVYFRSAECPLKPLQPVKRCGENERLNYPEGRIHYD